MAAANAQKVTKLRDFPSLDEDDVTKRPFRLWNTSEKKQVNWAFFKNLRHAHMRALNEAAWSRGDSVFEVFDIRNGGLRGQYHRHGEEIRFWRSHHHIEES